MNLIKRKKVFLGFSKFYCCLYWIQNYILICYDFIKNIKNKNFKKRKKFLPLEIIDFEKTTKIFFQNSTEIHKTNKIKFNFFISKNRLKFNWYKFSIKKKKALKVGGLLYRFISDINQVKEKFNVFKNKNKIFFFWFKPDFEFFLKFPYPASKLGFLENYLIFFPTKFNRINYFRNLFQEYKAINLIIGATNRDYLIINKCVNSFFWEINQTFNNISIKHDNSLFCIDFFTKKILEQKPVSKIDLPSIYKDKNSIKTRIICYWISNSHKSLFHVRDNYDTNLSFFKQLNFSNDFFKISSVTLSKFFLSMFVFQKKFTYLNSMYLWQDKLFCERNPTDLLLAHFLVLKRFFHHIHMNIFFFRKF